MLEQSETYCCEEIRSQIEFICKVHKDCFECPDNLIYKSKLGEFGIIIHDGGTSFVTINYCPWCGTKLVPNIN